MPETPTPNPDRVTSPSPKRRFRYRSLLMTLAALCILGGGFIWGVAFHRYHVFPYNLVRNRIAKSERVFVLERKLRVWRAAVARPHFRHDTRTEDIVSVSPTLDLVQSIPYVAGTMDSNPENKGVTTFDRSRAWDGLNLYVSGRKEEVLLIEMDGSIVHRWSLPDLEPREAMLLPNGDIIAISENRGLLRLDKRSNIIWQKDGHFHHGVTPGFDNDFWTLDRERRIVPEVDRAEPTAVDSIVHYSLDGEELARLPIHQLILDSPYWFLLPSLGDRKIVREGGVFDVLHTNWVTEFDGSLEERGEIYRRGNLLVSVRNINAIMVVDPEAKKVLWMWGPSNLPLQHNPRILPNGNFLLFDNGVDVSRVIEINPLTRSIEWQYAPRSGFYSDTRGHCQRLPNGNTLISESNTGYAFEVTPDGETVWQFANPDVNRNGFRYMIDEVERHDRASLTFLAGSRPAAGSR